MKLLVWTASTLLCFTRFKWRVVSIRVGNPLSNDRNVEKAVHAIKWSNERLGCQERDDKNTDTSVPASAIG